MIGIGTGQLLGGRGLCEWMVSAGAAGLRAGRLWRRQYRAIARGVWRAGNRRGSCGFNWGFWTFGVLAGHLAGDLCRSQLAMPQAAEPPKSFAEIVRPLNDSRSWVLSLYYFLTFGGFVAMAVYLPIFLTEMFQLTPQDAGLRTAGFVVLATVMRPVGGVLADKVGGRTILKWVFPATAMLWQSSWRVRS